MTVQDVMSKFPCYQEWRIEELFAGREEITLPDVWDLEIPIADKIWMFCHFADREIQRKLVLFYVDRVLEHGNLSALQRRDFEDLERDPTTFLGHTLRSFFQGMGYSSYDLLLGLERRAGENYTRLNKLCELGAIACMSK